MCGYCVGGIVAFEVARILTAAGKKVELIGIIDPPTANAHRSVQILLSVMRGVRPLARPFVESLMARTWKELTRLDAISVLSRSERIRNSVWQFIGMGKAELAAVKKRVEPPMTDRDRQYARTMSNYFPKPIAVRTIFFSADFDGEGWRPLSPDLEVVKLNGDHAGVVNNSTDLASYLKARLEGVSK